MRLRTAIAMALAWCLTASIGGAVITFTDASVTSGITSVTRGRECALVDFDCDGDLDIMVWNNLSTDDQLYQNDGSAHFVNVAGAMGINGAGAEEQQGGGFADYKNDGFPDVYVPNLDRENQFFRNNNGASFQEISSDLGLDDQMERRGVAWADIDSDSLLDFYVGTIPRSTEATAFLAINDVSAPFKNEASARGLCYLLNDQSPMWFDWGSDGDLDLFIGAFFYTAPEEMENRLFENDGQGFFTDASDAINASGEVTTGVQLADFDGDGRMDIFVLERTVANVVWRDNGDGTFTDIASAIGLEMIPDAPGGIPEEKTRAIVADFDNDMDLDVFVSMLDLTVGGEPPPMFWVNDGGIYTEMATQAGLTRAVNSWGCAAGDLNGDGFLDIFEVENNDFGTSDTLWLNNGNSNHWIVIDPEGVESNRDAIGLKVWLTAGGVTQVQELYSTTTHPLRLHFGLGPNTTVDELRLRWPNGLVEYYTDLPADQVFCPLEGATLTWAGQGVFYR